MMAWCLCLHVRTVTHKQLPSSAPGTAIAWDGGPSRTCSELAMHKTWLTLHPTKESYLHCNKDVYVGGGGGYLKEVWVLKSAPRGWRMLPSKACLEVKGYGRVGALYLAAFLSHLSVMLTARSLASFLPALAACFCLQK